MSTWATGALSIGEFIAKVVLKEDVKEDGTKVEKEKCFLWIGTFFIIGLWILA
jgi:hypothetical protein